ncbi:alpha/beta hydrolase [Streptomyces nodosus]|uniref:alpha/beta hydrolase n=1 Tax=Streptomyces nodosus TaxID=40318 RepID=UPI0036E7B270
MQPIQPIQPNRSMRPMQSVFVLVHSPSVGPSTWHPVAEHLTAAGHRVRVPSLPRLDTDAPPFWPRIADAVRDDLRQVPAGTPVTLVAHSNAGLFLPVIRSGLEHPVAGSVFVDAALPARTGSTPVAPPELLEFLRPMAVDGRLPRWTDWWDEADVAPMFPDPAVRRTVVEEQPTLPLSYYEQRIPVPDGWDDHPCSYLLFGPPYDDLADEARTRGWPVAHLPGAHLHQTVDPAGTARHLLELTTTM